MMLNKKSKYYKQRLNKYNIEKYLLEKFPCYNEIETKQKKVIELDSFLQRNFGEKNDGDCTLTSLMTIIYYHCNKTINYETIYTVVRSFATKHLFTNKMGTIPFFIKSIFDKSLKTLNIRHLKTNAAMVKGAGFNLNTIKKVINNKKPIIFSIFNDGRNYYTNHSITIIGYEIFKLKNNKNQIKEYPMLIVYDNWYKTEAYVDYYLVSKISSINY